MSPLRSVSKIGADSFPRVSGDEPRVYDMARAVAEFSPREWG